MRSPASTADDFLAAWQASDWVQLSRLAVGTDSPVGDVLEEWKKELHVSDVRFTTGEAQITNDTATIPFHASVEISAVGTWEYDSTLELVPQDDAWAVVWQERIMHPSLGPGDRLDLITTWPERGTVTDKAGRSLTRSMPRVRVGMVPERIVSRDEVAAAFDLALGVSRQAIDDILDRPGVQPDWFLPVVTIPREAYADVRPVLFPVPGVTFRITNNRVPIDPGGAAPLVGTIGEVTAESLAQLGSPYGVGSIVGTSGLEAVYERELAGTPTRRIVRRGADGSVQAIETYPGLPAADHRTTLSFDVQRAAESALSELTLPASLVAIDIDTGEIRAAASTPPDGFRRSTNGRYPPGSTFKIVVAASLLKDGLRRDSLVSCPSVTNVSGKEFGNAAPLAASMTFEEAFFKSCNTFFIEAAIALGPEAITQSARNFGFGDETDIGIRTADSSFEISEDPVENAAAAIGQGRVLATPLSLASMAATAASGMKVSPTLVPRANPDFEQVLDTDVIADLALMMRAVVDRGTGTAAQVAGTTVAGKTGTAQVSLDGELTTVAWFVGFVDGLAFAVNVEGGASGGSTAGPVVAAFLEAINAPRPASLPECVHAGSDWVMFQGDMTRSGCSAADSIVTPEVRWEADVGISGWLNSPIVADGLVVVGSAGDRRGTGDVADGVYALDVRDGAPRWHFRTANDVNGVAATGDLVVATGDEGTVWGLQLSTGTQIWSFDAGAPVFTNPLIVGDLIIVGDASGALIALEYDGTERWRADLDGAIRGGAASDGRMVYAVTDQGDVAAFTIDGYEMWRTRITYPRLSSIDGGARTPEPVNVYAVPTVADDKVIIAFTVEGGPTTPALVALDKYVGSITWWGSNSSEAFDFANLRNSPARHGDNLVIASSISYGVQGVDAVTGQAAWKTDQGVVCKKQWASAIVISDIAVLPRPDGSVQAFDVVTGEGMWRITPSGTSENAPNAECVADGREVHDGAQFHASIAVTPDGTLIVASTSRSIYAIGEHR